jgi:hypothetical protein
MQLKPLSRSVITKFSALSILTGMFVFSGAQIAAAGSESNDRTQPINASTPTEPRYIAIDSYTDHFFYAANPELNKRKLDSDESGYIREWQAIRQAIRPLIKSDRETCGRNIDTSADPYWNFDLQTNMSSYDYLTDVIFYHRNPDMAGQKLRPGTALAREWSAIRRNMFVSTCGL